ncbi:MAG: signal peptidase I [Candidatus Nealsonbacteria bacterium]|nr:signal peptidase I [Candidatus Nealsonbacteria bacterium]
MLKNTLFFIWEVAKIVIIALLIVIPIRYFIFQPFLVRGESMVPNFHNGDYLIVDEISYRLREPQRGEVIVFRFPDNPSLRYIKRIIGLPGETVKVENSKVFVGRNAVLQPLDESLYIPADLTPGDIKITLDENEYFVLGDNRDASSDSRKWGPLDTSFIIGRVFLRVLPLSALAQIEVPAY